MRIPSMSSSSVFESHVDHIRRRISTLEVVYAPHDHWPLPPRSSPSSAHLNISILDSSFNPPTLAHLALANIPFSQAFRRDHTHRTADCNRFHAKLLLLSVTNADKALEPGDATYEQRKEMMELLAQDVKSDVASMEDNDQDAEDCNTAVAIIDEPTFVGKARVLLDFLRKEVEPTSINPELTFIVGMDTLERLFAPRYYDSQEDMYKRLSHFFSPDGDNCRVICARRAIPGLAVGEDKQERDVTEAAKEFISANRIAIVDIDDSVRSFSSTETRAAIQARSSRWTTMVTPGLAEYITQRDLYTQA